MSDQIDIAAASAPERPDGQGGSVNVDTATLIKPTRWHVRHEDMHVTGQGTAPILEALAENHVLLPARPTGDPQDPAVTVRNLGEADSRLLLMSLVALTGDEALLDRFAPYIKAQFGGGAKGLAQHSIPPGMEAELRERLAELLASPGQTRPITAPMLRKMMSVCAGEPIGVEFIPLLLEQAGFTGVQGLAEGAHRPAPGGFKVAVIGAGLSGIAAGIMLGALGYDFEIFDSAPDAGGTWYLNRYPGVGVDTPSHYYSYSFEINPDWPRYFSKGDALIDYFHAIVQKYDLRSRISFETTVTSCRWGEASACWTVQTRNDQGEERTIAAQAVITGISQTNTPEIPAIPGLDRFTGEVAHTARWGALDLRGKRVAVIGTGASSMQVCTTIAPDVAHLTVFQRTPHWILPNPMSDKVVPDGARWAMRHVPFYANWQRLMTYWTGADNVYPVAVVDPDWSMPDVSVSEPNEKRRQMLLKYIGDELEGRPDLIEKVTPRYPVMGKRIILDSGWYKMLRRDNVSLEADGIDHIEENAIVTRNGERIEIDVLILATGFRFRPMLATLEITGRDGLTLAEAWQDEDPRAYLGVMVPRFPNLFVINGPNSAPNHGAGANLFAEGALNYVLGVLDLLNREGASTVEPRREAFEEYNRALDDNLRRMVWNHPKASSYYLNSKRRNTVSVPWRLVDYWWMMREPRRDDLDIR
jgi:4-hydroxyacetophenone monooxygenase